MSANEMMSVAVVGVGRFTIISEKIKGTPGRAQGSPFIQSYAQSVQMLIAAALVTSQS